MARFFPIHKSYRLKKQSKERAQLFQGAIKLSGEQFRTFLDGFGLFLIHVKRSNKFIKLIKQVLSPILNEQGGSQQNTSRIPTPYRC